MHLADADYAAHKTRFAAAALGRAGFTTPLAPLIRTKPHGRRRMDFAIQRSGGGIRLGLHPWHSHEVTDLQSCLVLHPALFALLAPLRPVLAGLRGLRRQGSVVANLLDSGPDLLLRLDAPVTAPDRAALAAFAAAHAIPRIATAVGDGAPETAVQLSRPVHRFAGHAVVPPPGAFLQASEAGEAAIAAAVLAGVGEKSRRIIELFAGIGTLSFPLATRGRVEAHEGDEAASTALRQAAGGTTVSVWHRDLARQPLAAREFAGADAVVLDPPPAGAGCQMAGLAGSGARRIAYVSCNPNTLARDAMILREAGYDLETATLIDQFLWSARLEMVAVFTRSPRRARAGRAGSSPAAPPSSAATVRSPRASPAPVRPPGPGPE